MKCLFQVFVLFAVYGTSGFLSYGQSSAKAKVPGGPPTQIPQALIEGLESHPDLVYAKYGDRELALDLYRPKSAEGEMLPVIVCIHGGGWWQGSRTNHAKVAQALADRGFVTATISYRLSGEAPFPAQIQDCKAAVRFLRANAEQYGIDPDHIGAIGLSAGGHLTALLATSGGVESLEGGGGNPEESSAIQAAVPMGAQSDFNAEHIQAVIRPKKTNPNGKPPIWIQFLGGTPQEVPEKYKLASPLTHLDAGDPPIHFIAGGLDNEGTRAIPFREKLDSLEIPSELTVIENAPHAFPGRQAFFDQAMDAAAKWFKTYFK